MRSKITKLTSVLAVVVLLITATLLAITYAQKSLLDKGTELESRVNTANVGGHEVLQSSAALKEWIADPNRSSASLNPGATYVLQIDEVMTSAIIRTTLNGNGATIRLEGSPKAGETDVVVSVEDTSKNSYGILFQEITSGGKINDLNIINNVKMRITISQNAYWQGNGSKGQSTFWFGIVAGALTHSGIIESCNIVNNGKLEVINATQTTNPNTTYKLRNWAFVAALVGRSYGGTISYCNVTQNGEIYAHFINPPTAGGNWHMWVAWAAVYVGKLENNGKLISNKVSITNNAKMEAYGISQNDGSSYVSFYIGEYSSGTVNGVIYDELPNNNDQKFKQSDYYDWNRKDIGTSKIFMYCASNVAPDEYIYASDKIDDRNQGNTRYTVTAGASAAYSVIPSIYYPDFAKSPTGDHQIKLNMSEAFVGDTNKNAIVYSVNGINCYNQLSKDSIIIGKWSPKTNPNFNIVKGTMMPSRVSIVKGNAIKTYNGQEINLNDAATLKILDARGEEKGTVATSNYKPIFNHSSLKNAGQYTLIGVKMNGSENYLSKDDATKQVWPIKMITVDQDNDELTINRKTLNFSTSGNTIYNAKLVLNSGLVSGDTVTFQLGKSSVIFNSMNTVVALDSVDFTGKLLSGAEIGINYVTNSEINATVSAHRINLSQNIEVVKQDANSITAGVGYIDINRVLGEIGFRAIVKDYGYSYSNWAAKGPSGQIVNGVLNINESTNSRLLVNLVKPQDVKSVTVDYKIRAIDFNSGIDSVNKNGNIQLKRNGTILTANNFTGDFGDKINLVALPSSSSQFSHWATADGQVYSYAKELSFRLYKEYDLKANFINNDNTKTVTFIYHDIAGVELCRQKVASGLTVGNYLSKTDIVYPYAELFKTFKGWMSTTNEKQVLNAGDEVKVYPLFLTSKTVKIEDNVGIMKTGEYDFNYAIKLPQGSYSINGINVIAPKEGLIFNAINDVVINKNNATVPTKEGMVAHLEMSNNTWYYVGTLVSHTDYRFHGFKLEFKNKTTNAMSDILITRYTRYGDIENGYIYHFIVAINPNLSAFMGNNYNISLISNNKVLGVL